MTIGSNMITVELKIKGMICSRCLKVLKNELRSTGAEVVEIILGKIVVRYNSDNINGAAIKKIIEDNDFEIITTREDIIAEKTKMWVIEYIRNTDMSDNISDYLVKKVEMNYDLLSKIFSKNSGKTIERYCMLIKIEHVKELIENDEMSFSEIAYATGYQNPSALSRLFKHETGMTMTEYKNLEGGNRIPLDKI